MFRFRRVVDICIGFSSRKRERGEAARSLARRVAGVANTAHVLRVPLLAGGRSRRLGASRVAPNPSIALSDLHSRRSRTEQRLSAADAGCAGQHRGRRQHQLHDLSWLGGGRQSVPRSHAPRRTDLHRLSRRNDRGREVAEGGRGATRTPFVDEPRCESCHTRDELSHLGASLVLRKAYEDGDVWATPRLATNRRYAEEAGKLYRQSVGHGGVACMSCHGSTHAIWPVSTSDTRDNETPIALQGHAGSISGCGDCHPNPALL